MMCSSLCCLVVAVSLAGTDGLRVLPAREDDSLQSAMVYRYLRELADEAIKRRKEAYEGVKTPEQVRAWQKARREFFWRQLGPMPQRTPLEAKVVGTLSGDGYRVEKVIYQSQPGHHVTAVVYLPRAGTPPYPGVLIPCGHSYDGKAADGYQRIGMLLARSGIAALCYDPIGQGERYQVLNPDGSPLPNPEPNPYSLKRLAEIPGGPQYNPVEEHNLVGIGSVLLGLNTARYRIWDGLRSMDYLAGRPEVDPKRLGCTGNSGGGTLCSYLMALDERIVAAAPACFLTTFERLLDTRGPQDAEQNIFGQLAFGMDEADYVLMRAPKPTLICAATRDATFDIAGTWEIFREAKRFYTRLGFAERVDLVETDDRHGFTIQLRVGAVRWMRRWLLGVDDAMVEPDLPIRADEQLQCSPRGQVMLMPRERSVFELNRRINEQLAPRRKEFWASRPKAEALRRVRAIIGARRMDELPRPKSRVVGTLAREGCQVEKLVLEPEPGIQLPALVFLPPKPAPEAYLYLDGRGKQADAAAGGRLEGLAKGGHLVMAVDLRGLGETGLTKRTSSYYLKDQEYSLAYLLGKSLVGMRTEDALVCARFLAGYRSPGKARRVHVVGIGAAGVAALHAVALEPERFASVRLRRVLGSWCDVLRTPVPRDQLGDAVHGALRTYDLPDLVRSLGRDKVVVEEPVTFD